MRHIGAAILLCLAVANGGLAGPRPNIVVIVSDDHSWDQLAVAGHPNALTPRIDQLAREGIRFDRAYATAPQCLPSRASLLAGRSPVAMGMTRFTAPVPRNVQLVPDFLRPAGYYVGIAGRSHHLDGWSFTESIPQLYAKHQLPNAAARFDFARESNRGTAEARREEFFGQLAEFYASVPTDRPYFLQFNLLDPHRPFSNVELNAWAKPYDPAQLALPPDMPDTPAVRADYALFLGMISRMDHDVGRVLDLIEERGESDRTLVIFVADNGAAVFRGKGTLYEHGIRVPLVCRWPGVAPQGQVNHGIVSLEDVAATILDVAGVEVPESMTGRSLKASLAGQPATGRPFAFAERGAHGDPLPTNASCLDFSRCVVGERYKLIYNATWQIPYWPVDFFAQPFWLELVEQHRNHTLEARWEQLFFAPQRPMFELYDLHADPHELHNLIDDPRAKPTADELKLRLAEWMLVENDYLPLPAPDAPAER